VRPDGAFSGTIGGGRLEWDALALARAALGEGRGPAALVERVLGLDLGQCCGGRVRLLVETFDGRDSEALATLGSAEAEGGEVEAWWDDGRVVRSLPQPRAEALCHPRARSADPRIAWTERLGEPRTDLLLFGAGHVGRALVLALAPLPFSVRWVDSRPDAFPPHVPANATPVRTDDPVAEIAAARAGTFVLVMTHAHPLDLALAGAALGRLDLPFVGLIGSATKRARFVRRFRQLGIPEARLAALACPIGLPGISGKEPAIIAAATAAQMLREREARHGAVTHEEARHERAG
jgi:xanthine dehydrogenase accessory factor